MEGIQTIQALKAVQSSLPAQTTIPSDELVMLYAADGTPIAKIARDDLVKAVASVMASNSQNTFSKLLGVQANGTPMGIGASDLASVLGVRVSLYNGTLTAGSSVSIRYSTAASLLMFDCNDGGSTALYLTHYWGVARIAKTGNTDFDDLLTLQNDGGKYVKITAKTDLTFTLKGYLC